MKINIKKTLLYGSITVYVLFFFKFCVLPAIPSRLYFALDEAWGDTPIDSALYVNLAHITPFEWDTMYYYERLYPSDSINEKHNKDFGFSDAGKCFRLVFTKQNEVVYSVEQEPVAIDEYPGYEFTHHSVNWQVGKDDAVFRVTRDYLPFYIHGKGLKASDVK